MPKTEGILGRSWGVGVLGGEIRHEFRHWGSSGGGAGGDVLGAPWFQEKHSRNCLHPFLFICASRGFANTAPILEIPWLSMAMATPFHSISSPHPLTGFCQFRPGAYFWVNTLQKIGVALVWSGNLNKIFLFPFPFGNHCAISVLSLQSVVG